jgi:hypothetical protein
VVATAAAQSDSVDVSAPLCGARESCESPRAERFDFQEIAMKKLLPILTAGAFALGSVAAMAQDKTPAQPVDQKALKAEKDKAKADAAKMTPEEKAAAKKAKGAKKQKDMVQIEKAGQPNAPAKNEATDKTMAATKGDPKPLPDKKARQEALKETTKKAGPAQ